MNLPPTSRHARVGLLLLLALWGLLVAVEVMR